MMTVSWKERVNRILISELARCHSFHDLPKFRCNFLIFLETMRTILLGCCLIVLLVVASAQLTPAEVERRRREDLVLFPMYPTSVPHFPVRKDPYSKNGEPVVRGRFDLINGIPEATPGPNGKKFTIAEFKKRLQCSVSEPALDELYGTMSLMLLDPPTKETFEMIALWVETRCANQGSDWSACHRLLPNFRNKQYPAEFNMHKNFGWTFQMLRIIKGELYHDWPWGIERIPKYHGITAMFAPLAMVVSLLTDVKDSVFLFGAEKGYLPWTFNIAHITMVSNSYSHEYQI